MAIFYIINQLTSVIQKTLQAWMQSDGLACCVAISLNFDIAAADYVLLKNMSPSRRAEFISGRHCAYVLLNKLGIFVNGLPNSELGGPIWPLGVIGSITHESGICAVVVARASSQSGVGIDIFDRRHRSDILEIAHLILTPHEMSSLDKCNDPIDFVQLSFSIKEAVVKAISSLVGRILDMREIQLSIHEDSFVANISFLKESIAGKWCRVDPFILSFAVIEQKSPV